MRKKEYFQYNDDQRNTAEVKIIFVDFVTSK